MGLIYYKIEFTNLQGLVPHCPVVYITHLVLGSPFVRFLHGQGESHHFFSSNFLGSILSFTFYSVWVCFNFSNILICNNVLNWFLFCLVAKKIDAKQIGKTNCTGLYLFRSVQCNLWVYCEL
jgi:hypothetical protein